MGIAKIYFLRGDYIYDQNGHLQGFDQCKYLVSYTRGENSKWSIVGKVQMGLGNGDNGWRKKLN